MDANSRRPGADRLPVLLTAAVLLLALLAHAPHGLPFSWDDQGQYLSHARALLEGRPYGDIGFITTPYNNFIGPVVAPPGLPLLITPALALGGGSVIPVRIVIVLSMLGLALLAWTLAERSAGRWVASAVVMASVAAFAQQHAFDGILADLPFAMAIWIVILAGESDRPLDRGRLAAMAFAGALAFSLRMAALALLPALALFALLRPRREWGGLAVVGLVWAVAAALVLFGLPTSSALATEATRGASDMMGDAVGNLMAMMYGALEGFLYPFPSAIANDVWHVLALALAALGAWQIVRTRHRRFAVCFAIAYVAMLVVIPTNAVRYWWPLVPLQWYALFEGAAVIVRRLAPAVARWWPGPIIAVLSLAAIARSIPEPEVPFGERPELRDVIAAIESSAGTGDTARVWINAPRLFTWHTRIPAMGQFVATPDETLAELRARRITFLVRGLAGAHDFRPFIDSTIAAHPAAFDRLGQFGDLTLFKVLP
ncbi:MAG: hypothetical protein HUU26_09640 [Gemmatimonadaceae bacterium]|nr:hypothetical protein [Gemmatimonadaceae bacterium]